MNEKMNKRESVQGLNKQLKLPASSELTYSLEPQNEKEY